MKNIVKTESVAEFLARGGKITKVAMNVGRRAVKSEAQKAEIMSKIDMSALPESLRIKLGIK
jgi:hypothetical protein